MISEKTYKLLVISQIPNVGKAMINKVAKQISDWELDVNQLALKHFANQPRVSLSHVPAEAIQKADDIVAQANQFGDTIISQQDDIYPNSLRLTADAPAFLYCRGNIDLLNSKSIAVIGTREPSEHGKLIGERVTKWFVEQGWVIVSGLARGIDTIAHQTCLANNGKTIAIYGNHLNKVYPAENKNLVQEILDSDGLLISEYDYHNEGRPSQFVERDRIQAGLSTGVVLVQSDLTGGSMHASKAILKYGRYLIVLNQSNKDINERYIKTEANLFLLRATVDDVKMQFGLKTLEEAQLIKLMGSDDYDKANAILLKQQQEFLSHSDNSLF